MIEITYNTFARRLGAECQKENKQEGHEGHVLYLIPSHNQQLYDGRGIDGSIDWDNVGGYSIEVPEVVLGCSCELIVSEETTTWGRIESCQIRSRHNQISYINRMEYQYIGCGDNRYGVTTNATVLSNGIIRTDKTYRYPFYFADGDCVMMNGMKNFRFTDGTLQLVGYGYHVDSDESLSLTQSHQIAKQINPDLDPWYQQGDGSSGWRTYIKEGEYNDE